LFEKGRRKGKWEYNKGGDLVQGTLYMCMELSQQNPLIFMYANPKIKANFKNTL
jgi:hypothetical protein